MNTLHLVRSSAYSDNQLSLCLNATTENDTVILLDDGCYNIHHALLSGYSLDGKVSFYMVATHAKARGIDSKECELIDIEKLLALSFTHNNVITWQI